MHPDRGSPHTGWGRGPTVHRICAQARQGVGASTTHATGASTVPLPCPHAMARWVSPSAACRPYRAAFDHARVAQSLGATCRLATHGRYSAPSRTTSHRPGSRQTVGLQTRHRRGKHQRCSAQARVHRRLKGSAQARTPCPRASALGSPTAATRPGWEIPPAPLEATVSPADMPRHLFARFRQNPG